LRTSKEQAFRRRLSGVVFKPPYAADDGNISVVSDKEKNWDNELRRLYHQS
jgi:hypothetical protein